jgi:hypothetical protein
MSRALPYLRSFRLTKNHKILFSSGMYAKYAGLLVRLLLDSVIAGEQFLVLNRFKQAVQKLESDQQNKNSEEVA